MFAEKCGGDIASRYPLKADVTQSYEDRHIELNFGVANENYEIADLMTKAEEPKDAV